MPSNCGKAGKSRKNRFNCFYALLARGLPAKGIAEERGFGKCLESISELNRSPTLICQAVNSELVLGEEQARHAALLALNAFLNKENRSNRKELEFLLWLSGKRQLDKAISAFGLEGRTKGLEGNAQEVLVVSASLKSEAEARNGLERICRELGLKRQAGRQEKAKGSFEERKAMDFYGINEKMIACFTESGAESKAKRKEAIEGLVLEKMALLALEV